MAPSERRGACYAEGGIDGCEVDCPMRGDKVPDELLEGFFAPSRLRRQGAIHDDIRMRRRNKGVPVPRIKGSDGCFKAVLDVTQIISLDHWCSAQKDQQELNKVSNDHSSLSFMRASQAVRHTSWPRHVPFVCM